MNAVKSSSIKKIGTSPERVERKPPIASMSARARSNKFPTNQPASSSSGNETANRFDGVLSPPSEYHTNANSVTIANPRVKPSPSASCPRSVSANTNPARPKINASGSYTNKKFSGVVNAPTPDHADNHTPNRLNATPKPSRFNKNVVAAKTYVRMNNAPARAYGLRHLFASDVCAASVCLPPRRLHTHAYARYNAPPTKTAYAVASAVSASPAKIAAAYSARVFCDS